MNDEHSQKLETIAENAEKTKTKKSLEEEIAKASAKLQKLQELQRELLRRDRERNEREIKDIFKTEKLNDFPAEVWRQAAVEIHAVLERAAGETNVSIPKKTRKTRSPKAAT